MRTNRKYIWASVHHVMPGQLEELDNAYDEQVEFPKEMLDEISGLTKDSAISTIAFNLLRFASDNDCDIIQPGGNPAFHTVLGNWWRYYEFDRFTNLVFAHNKRVSADALTGDGAVKKVSFFRPDGWWFNGKYVLKLVSGRDDREPDDFSE